MENLKSYEISDIFKILSKEFNDNVETELVYFNNFQLLIAVMLSAQSTDKQVNKVVEKLFDIVKEPDDVVKLGYEKLNEIIKTINYHNVKSRNIVETSKKIIKNFNNKVPNNLEDLMSLNGVGRKTANLVLSIAFKQNRIAVDTHVFRVSNRIGITKAKTPLETELQMYDKVDVENQRKINTLLIQLGRKYCKAIKPKCNQCPLRKYCKLKIMNNKV